MVRVLGLHRLAARVAWWTLRLVDLPACLGVRGVGLCRDHECILASPCDPERILSVQADVDMRRPGGPGATHDRRSAATALVAVDPIVDGLQGLDVPRDRVGVTGGPVDMELESP